MRDSGAVVSSSFIVRNKPAAMEEVKGSSNSSTYRLSQGTSHGDERFPVTLSSDVDIQALLVFLTMTPDDNGQLESGP
jgi:hypothetical protein